MDDVIASDLTTEEARELLRQLHTPKDPAAEAMKRLRMAQLDRQLMDVVQRTRDLEVAARALVAEVLTLNSRVRQAMAEDL